MAKHVKRMGLTLLELLLVIVIIGLLLAMMMPATRQVREARRLFIPHISGETDSSVNLIEKGRLLKGLLTQFFEGQPLRL